MCTRKVSKQAPALTPGAKAQLLRLLGFATAVYADHPPKGVNAFALSYHGQDARMYTMISNIWARISYKAKTTREFSGVGLE